MIKAAWKITTTVYRWLIGPPTTDEDWIDLQW
jgi:hypothetical protein